MKDFGPSYMSTLITDQLSQVMISSHEKIKAEEEV